MNDHDQSANRPHLMTNSVNLPNAISIVRILLAPLFMWMLLADASNDGALRWWAAAIFIVAIASDGIDGAIARRYGLVTELGKLLDPIADKVITGVALVGLVIVHELPWWVTGIILLREIGITLYRFAVISQGVISASWAGKLKTVAQAVAISFALTPLWALFGPWVPVLNTVLMTIAVVLTVASGLEYVVKVWQSRRRA